MDGVFMSDLLLCLTSLTFFFVALVVIVQLNRD
jgi:hypothetical protein